MENKRNSKFLQLMSILESSGGKNTNHPTVSSGIQAGDTAVGEHALMPNTAKELANRKMLSGEANISDEVVLNSDNKQVEQILKNNPELQNKYVNDLANNVMDNTQDPALGAVAWRYGHNIKDPNELKSLADQNPEYMNRIKKAMDQVYNKSEPQQFVDKFLTPVYIDKPFSQMRDKLRVK